MTEKEYSIQVNGMLHLQSTLLHPLHCFANNFLQSADVELIVTCEESQCHFDWTENFISRSALLSLVHK